MTRLFTIACLCFSLAIISCDEQKSSGKVAEKESSKTNDISINQIVDGKKVGYWKNLHQNGNIESEGEYIEGRKEGDWKHYWKSGILSEESFYVKDLPNGKTNWYSQTGQLAATGNMINGKRNGEWKICDWADGSFCVFGVFKDEREIGIWKNYHENGKVSKETTYNNGVVQGSVCYNEKGEKEDCDVVFANSK